MLEFINNWGTVIAILLACRLFYASYRFSLRFGERKKIAHLWASIALLLLAALILRLNSASHFYLNRWDERYHALAGKSTIANPLKPVLLPDPAFPVEVEDWRANHVWMHKPPMTLWLIGASLRIFGITEPAVRVPSILLGTLSIACTFLIGLWLFSSPVGWLAAFFHSINGFLIELESGRTTNDHTDALMAAFVGIGIFCAYLYARKPKLYWLPLIGILTACAILTKWLAGLLVIGVAALVIFKEKGLKTSVFATLIMLSFAALIAGAWEAFAWKNYPAEMAAAVHLHFLHMTIVMDGRGGGFLTYFLQMPRYFGEMIFLALLAFTYATIKNFSDQDQRNTNLILLVWWFVPFFLLSFAATKLFGFVMIAAIPLFLISAWFCIETWSESRDANKKWQRNIWIGVSMLTLILPIRYSLERQKPFKPFPRTSPEAEYIRTLKPLFARESENRAVLFGYPAKIQAMFHLPITAYNDVPKRSDLERIHNEGRAVFLYDQSAGTIGRYTPVKSKDTGSDSI